MRFEKEVLKNEEENPLSVVIPAKNLLLHLDKFIRIITQPSTRLIHLILVVDEDEINGTLVKARLQCPDVQKYLKEINFTVVYGEFNSPGAARNIGLKNVKSKWVTFWDSDDEPDVEKILSVVQKANDGDYEIAISGYQTKSLGKNSQPKSPSFGIDKARNLMLVANEPAIWRMTFLTKLAAQSEFPALIMGEDQVFISTIGLTNKRILFSDIVTYSYFTNQSGQLTGSKENLKDLLIAFKLNIRNLDRFDSHEETNFKLQIISREFITLTKNSFLIRVFVILRQNLQPSLLGKFLCNLFFVAIQSVYLRRPNGD
jgi:glycosyltransferase involved in cell wall biosynthesis